MPAKIQGTVLSILFALAISMAPALHGFVKRALNFGWAGDPGWVEAMPSLLVWSRDGERRGEEKESR